MKKLLMGSLLLIFAFTACKKDSASTPDEAGTTNTWKFTVNGRTYSGSILSGVYTTIMGPNLLIAGKLNNTDTLFSISIQFPGSSIETGSYKTSDLGTSMKLMAPNGDVVWAAIPLEDYPVTTIKVTSADAATKTVTGTFSGQAYNFDGITKDVTDGSFTATYTTL